jgi:hypothetical protein
MASWTLMDSWRGSTSQLAQDVLDMMYAGARSDSDSLRAVGFAADVTIADGDAVCVELEHRDGVALEASSRIDETGWSRR